MNEKRALKLTKSEEILEAAKEAETRNCEESVIRQLYANYYKAERKANEKQKK